jgi:chromosome segregation ATPase
MSIAEQLTEYAATQAAAAEEQFRKLIDRLVGGEIVSVAVIAEILEHCRRSGEDLSAAVEARKRRLALLAKVHRVPALQGELAEVESKIAEARKPLKKAEQKYAETQAAFRRVAEPLIARVEALQREIDQADGIHAELRASYPASGPLATEAAELSMRWREVARAFDTQQALVANTEAQIRVAQADLRRLREQGRFPDDGFDERVRRLESTIAELRASLPAQQATANELDAQCRRFSVEHDAIVTAMGEE